MEVLEQLQHPQLNQLLTMLLVVVAVLEQQVLMELELPEETAGMELPQRFQEVQ